MNPCEVFAAPWLLYLRTVWHVNPLWLWHIIGLHKSAFAIFKLKHRWILIVSRNFGSRSIRTVISWSLNVWRSYGKCWYSQLAIRHTPRFPRYHMSFKVCSKKLPELSGNRKNVKQPIHSLLVMFCSYRGTPGKGNAFWTCRLARINKVLGIKPCANMISASLNVPAFASKYASHSVKC